MAIKRKKDIPYYYAVMVLFSLFSANFIRNISGFSGYIVLAIIYFIAGIFILIRYKQPYFKMYRLSKTVIAILIWICASITWSAYRFETFLAIGAQLITTFIALVICFTIPWKKLLYVFATTFKIILISSILFELIVSVFYKKPLLPFVIDFPQKEKSVLLFWSRNNLFEFGPIQGIVGNSALLAFIALCSLTVFSIIFLAKLERSFTALLWVSFSIMILLLSKSATVFIALIAVLIVFIMVLITRKFEQYKRTKLYVSFTIFITLSITATIIFWDLILKLLGKSGTLTGRLGIWEKVWELIQQKPIIGWGWVSYWPIWKEPYKGLIYRNNIPVSHAHNAWLDLWLQIGIIGLILFILLVTVTWLRSWFRAVDKPIIGPKNNLPYSYTALLPILMLTALLVQSLSESRILSEVGWTLLIIFALKTKTDYEIPSSKTDNQVIPWRNLPIRNEKH